MEFIDLKAQQQRIAAQLESNIKEVLSHGKYIMGPEVKALEDNLAAYVGKKHAISCASGTDALLMALMACNIGPGDAIFTTPFTFIATAEVISLLGATPIFVDIDPVTFNLDPNKLDESIVQLKNEKAQSLRPKAIIAVDIFGLPADYDAIRNIAERNNLMIIEDAAQSFGGEYKGKKACSFGDIACTSFFPAKPFGCYGDGGMCFTDSDAIAEILKSIRVHGQGSDKYDNIRIGINGRLDTLQAAILLAKFEIFPDEIERRQIVAKNYSELLKPFSRLTVPTVPDGYKSAWAQYSIMAQDEGQRKNIINVLSNSGVPTAIYYPKPLHLQTAFSFLNYEKGAFPVSENVSSRIFSLPMHPYLKLEEQKTIAQAIS